MAYCQRDGGPGLYGLPVLVDCYGEVQHVVFGCRHICRRSGISDQAHFDVFRLRCAIYVEGCSGVPVEDGLRLVSGLILEGEIPPSNRWVLLKLNVS